MTALESFARNHRRMRRIGLAGFVPFAAGAVLAGFDPGNPAALALLLGGFAVMGGGMMFAEYRWFRCPCCGGNLGTIVVGGRGFAPARPVRFCPFCGDALDRDDSDQLGSPP